MVGLKVNAKAGRAPACNLKDPRMPAFAIIVPCRLESTRFPRKLLHEIKGRPLLLWVAERIAQQAPKIPTWFAVDDALGPEVGGVALGVGDVVLVRQEEARKAAELLDLLH